MSLKSNTHIRELQAPKQRILYTEPITDIITNKKIKLNTDKNVFIFFLTKTRPDLLFLDYKGNKTRLNALLKPYNNTDNLRQQFINILEEPQIIRDKITTLFIIEIIYITSYILSIDLLQYIDFICLDNLINYYFIRCKIDQL